MIKNLLCATFILVSLAGFSQLFDGYTLYNETGENTAYLIDKDYNIAHSWSCDLAANYAVHLKENGNLVRGAVNPGNLINGAAVGGRVQEIDPNGDVVWEFTYSDNNHVSHHDIAVHPNGNVFLIAWERIDSNELDDLGYTGNSNEKLATHIIEVQQNGTGGEIVWEWHIIDHMIQDADSSLDNFGVVEDHPELLNTNVSVGFGMGGDWFHCNGIDYNEELDQLVVSSRSLSEIFIIDHSTTSEEAASHSGGNSGKGGDFLYRYGNPNNYGASGNQQIPDAVHDPRWIKEGRPNAGYIQFFNNEGGLGGDSAVDAINPEMESDGYNYVLTPGEAYGPSDYDFRHDCLDNSAGQSASDRMSNGNIFVCISMEYLYEVDEDDNVVWQYQAEPTKAFRFECEYPGIQELLDNPCETPNQVENIDRPNVLFFYPNPSADGLFKISGYKSNEKFNSLEIYDLTGKKILSQKSNLFLDLSDLSNGLYLTKIYMNSGDVLEDRITIQR